MEKLAKIYIWSIINQPIITFNYIAIYQPPYLIGFEKLMYLCIIQSNVC
jgi:hypothetical protein